MAYATSSFRSRAPSRAVRPAGKTSTPSRRRLAGTDRLSSSALWGQFCRMWRPQDACSHYSDMAQLPGVQTLAREINDPIVIGLKVPVAQGLGAKARRTMGPSPAVGRG
jgi:hypothetical protein